MQTRKMREGDVPALQDVVSRTGLFPAQMLRQMTAGFFGGSSSDIWLSAVADGTPVGFCTAVPEPLADGTWNMQAIAVTPAAQRSGCGHALVGELESRLRAKGARILLADTSGTPDYAGARAFYRKTGYTEEARIRDFWATDDDKVTFRKALG